MNYIEKTIEDTISEYTEFDRSGGELTREELERFQAYRLNRLVSYAKENSEMYAQTLADAGEIKTIEDIRRLPFTTAADLRHRPYKMMCITMGGVVRTFSHFTTGTTGMPKRIMFSESDVEKINRNMRGIIGMMLHEAVMDPRETRLGVYLPDFGRPFSMAEMISQAGQALGCTTYKGSCADIAEGQIEELLWERPDVIMGSAFRIWRIVQSGIEAGKLRELDIRAIMITSEYMPESMRKGIEEAFGAEVYHHYGMTEPGFAIGIECGMHRGYHWNEADLYFEIIDPKTGEVLPDGEEGELVLTTLDRQAQPLIRYRTGDIASMKHSSRCSDILSSIGVLTRRIGLTHKFRNGGLFYSSLSDEALYCLPDMLDYRIYLTDTDGTDHMKCVAERIGTADDFRERVERALRSIETVRQAADDGVLVIDPVEICGRGDLRRGGRTMKRKIVDERTNAGEEEPVLDLA